MALVIAAVQVSPVPARREEGLSPHSIALLRWQVWRISGVGAQANV